MPHVFNIYKEIMNIDIGTIVIYTCKASCISSKNKINRKFYLEEYVFIQRTGEKIIDFSNKNNSISKINNNYSENGNNENLIRDISNINIKKDEDEWIEVKKKKKNNDKKNKNDDEK